MTQFDISPLKQGAIHFHEMFKILVEAGFTEDQAIKILALYLAQYTGSSND